MRTEERVVTGEPTTRSAGLVVEGLTTTISGRRGPVTVVDNVSFEIPAGAIVGLVGESGCGKTMTALSLIRLLPDSAQVTAGRVMLGDVDVLGLSSRELQRLRGNEVAIVFQDPMASLDPCFTVGKQIVETVRAHRDMRTSEARRLAIEMLDRVGIPNASRRANDYPHQFSGGMRQRAMLAMALVLQPKLLIADEPTTALDVTIQAQILDLISRVRSELDMSVLLITHNFGVVDEIADDVVVMYAGEIVESSSVRNLLGNSRHPYTQGLLRSMPRPANRGNLLDVIPGRVPEMADLPPACRFSPRCPNRVDICDREHPELVTNDERRLRCFNPTTVD
jgi:oligopeptide/dipeptide ABC transporter ATP-binding protein